MKIEVYVMQGRDLTDFEKGINNIEWGDQNKNLGILQNIIERTGNKDDLEILRGSFPKLKEKMILNPMDAVGLSGRISKKIRGAEPSNEKDIPGIPMK